MVYTGKPSTACRTCRQRRIKCDETRPTCNQCLKSHRPCLGYPEQSSLIFQNQTTAVIRRANRINEANARRAAAAASTSTSTSRSTSAVPSPPPNDPTAFTPHSTSLEHRHNTTIRLSGPSPMDPSLLTLPALHHLASNTILPNPTEPIESRALTFFLNSMIVEPLSRAHHVGHLDLVPRLYLSSLSSSALAKTTVAMCIAAFCVVGADTLPIRERAYAAYGDAVAALFHALKDPGQRRRNETLLACVVMVVVESLLARDAAPSVQWASHIRGAAELLRQRGWEGVVGDPVARRLFGVVKGFMSHNPRNDVVGDEFWGREVPALVGGGGVGAMKPPEMRLGEVSVRVAVVRDRGLGLLLLPPDDGGGEVDALVRDCWEVERELCEWEGSLEEGYRFGLVEQLDMPHRSPYSPKDEGVSPKPLPESIVDLLPRTLHRYSDPHLQRLWNSYRIGRIVVLTLLYRACSLPETQRPSKALVPDPLGLAAATAATLVELVDSILASIPPHVLDPVVFERDGSMGRAAEIALAYYCLWPLYIARGVKCLGRKRRGEIRLLMERVVSRYEIRNGVALMEAGDAVRTGQERGKRKGSLGEGEEEEEDEGGGDRPLFGPAWDSSWLEGVWEWTFLYGCGAI